VASLERAYRLNAVIFDKTGTLTEGRPRLVSLHAIRGSDDELLRRAASVQQGSEHPLARAMLDRAAELRLPLDPVTEFRSFTGLGVAGRAGGLDVAIGNSRFMAERSVNVSAASDRATDWQRHAQTVVFVAIGAELAGILGIIDPLREQSRAAISSLTDMGIRTLLLSGDAVPVAEEIGRQAGVSDARGEVRPDEKARVVEELSALGFTVGMIGDGINDAPALAAADVGIAMGTGTDIAMETAGITLMRPDPRLVAAAVAASRATFRKIRQNLFWAFIYNVIGIPLAALGMLSPALAGAAMAMSSVSVVSNSLLLRRWKPRFVTRDER
jgi:Cu+-exporting ATPase